MEVPCMAGQSVVRGWGERVWGERVWERGWGVWWVELIGWVERVGEGVGREGVVMG